jgi:hypothetical protein
MTHSKLHLTVVAALTLLLTPVARAGANSDDFRLDALPVPAKTAFTRGTKTFQTEISYISPIRYSVEEFTMGSVGVGYYLWDNHAITLMAHGFHVNQAFDEGTEGGAVFVLGRSHLYNPGGAAGRLSVYVDGGGGYSWANAAVPIGGTSYNINARAGVGLTFRLDDNCHLTAGARYFHLSNGKVHGSEKNPSYDGIEGYVGLLFTFR